MFAFYLPFSLLTSTTLNTHIYQTNGRENGTRVVIIYKILLVY